MLRIDIGFLRFYLAFIWAVDFPSMVSGAPVIGLVVDLIGVCFHVLWLFLIPLFFSISILCLLASFFMTLAVAFPLSLASDVSGRRGLEILGKLKIVILELIGGGGK